MTENGSYAKRSMYICVRLFEFVISSNVFILTNSYTHYIRMYYSYIRYTHILHNTGLINNASC